MVGRLPKPTQNGTKLGVHFFEALYPYDDKIRMKKNHHQTLELQASMHGPSRLHWPCTLAGSFEVQWWNLFLMLILSLYKWRYSKNALPTLFHFVRVRAAHQPRVHCRGPAYYGVTFETSFAHLPKSGSCKALTSVFAHSFKLVLTIDPWVRPSSSYSYDQYSKWTMRPLAYSDWALKLRSSHHDHQG